jgi:AcrR family transcriptional regulator
MYSCIAIIGFEMSKGRPREFNTTDALDQALLVFWRKGYRGTSLDDLTDVMQINRPSLYAAFGDKEKLFLAAVDQYREKYLVPRVRKLLSCDNLREGLADFFRSMSGVIIENETPPGCLIACLLSEESCESE